MPHNAITHTTSSENQQTITEHLDHLEQTLEKVEDQLRSLQTGYSEIEIVLKTVFTNDTK